MATTMSTRVTSGQEMANGYGTDAGGERRLMQLSTSSTSRMDDTGLGGMYEYALHNPL